jgi:hypothetical protein
MDCGIMTKIRHSLHCGVRSILTRGAMLTNSGKEKNERRMTRMRADVRRMGPTRTPVRIRVIRGWMLFQDSRRLPVKDLTFRLTSAIATDIVTSC